jgi:hypothetical protein
MSPVLADRCPSDTSKWLTLALFCCNLSCSAQNSTVSADVPRRAVPIPACVMPLPVRAQSQRQFMRQLSDAQLWRAVFPSFDDASGRLPEGAPTCTGEFLFNDARLKDAHVRRPWPFLPEPGDLLFGAGPKRTKIVWFKTHEWNDGATGGVVAMVRAEEDFAEVYGVGIFRGAPERSRFASERIGGTVVVTATDDRCTGKAPEEPCESWIHVLMPWKGQLVEQASIAVERRYLASKGEPGSTGSVLYRMTGTPMFEPARIRLLETIQAVDSTGRKLRNVELERRFDYVEGKLVERQASLWDRVVGEAGKGESPMPDAAADRPLDSGQATGSSATLADDQVAPKSHGQKKDSEAKTKSANDGKKTK